MILLIPLVPVFEFFIYIELELITNPIIYIIETLVYEFIADINPTFKCSRPSFVLSVTLVMLKVS